MSATLYRWECSSCRKHGRWLADGNLAGVFGERHEDRAPWGHRTVLVDTHGRQHGPCS